MAYFNTLILLILWMIMIGTSNTGKTFRFQYKNIFFYIGYTHIKMVKMAFGDQFQYLSSKQFK